ncbi:transposase [Kosakonia sp. S42]|uniref:transposase n=1 Tax=Kosakonia sp. S42 TaxID=2767458 RepID=UPI00190D9BCB|nr:transposase [Kosakonia sp. S42]MBK0019500.1 transposase [Kosakonia sp. S42]
MTEPTAPRQLATYSMPFKLDLVQRSLQPGACVALLARQNGINDNLLFTWRQRYRHLVDEPSDTCPAPPLSVAISFLL